MRISHYVLVPLVAWFIAQLLKYVVQALKTGNRRDFSYLYKSGNMPSAHSALMISLLVVLGVEEGLDSALFGTVLILTSIILYDAMNVRRSVGEQGLALHGLLKLAKTKSLPYHADGHTLADVAVGSLIGFVTAVAMLQFL